MDLNTKSLDTGIYIVELVIEEQFTDRQKLIIQRLKNH